MTSEKALYWMAVGVLGLGAVNGFVTRLAESAPSLIGRSLAMTQASEVVSNVAQMARLTLGGDNQDFDLPQMAQVRAQTRLACVQATLVRNQARIAKMQAERIQVQMLEYGPRSIAWPGGHVVVDPPQVPEIEPDDTF